MDFESSVQGLNIGERSQCFWPESRTNHTDVRPPRMQSRLGRSLFGWRWKGHGIELDDNMYCPTHPGLTVLLLMEGWAREQVLGGKAMEATFKLEAEVVMGRWRDVACRGQSRTRLAQASIGSLLVDDDGGAGSS